MHQVLLEIIDADVGSDKRPKNPPSGHPHVTMHPHTAPAGGGW